MVERVELSDWRDDMINSNDLLMDGCKEGYAVPAFNVENMEMVQGVLKAAEELKSPVILQTTPGTIRYSSLDVYRAMVESAAKYVSVPVVLHLDHGDSIELCRGAIAAGYTSVMFDGSKLPFEENVKLTRSVVEMAAREGVSVEGELGTIGGKEDNLTTKSGVLTNPSQAKEFVDRTGVDSIAIAIGTAHGFYKGTPKVDFTRLEQIREVVDVPLVLHGASGIPDKMIEKAVKLGINKVNFATELRSAYTSAVRNVLNEDPKVYDPKKYGTAARKAVEDVVKSKISMCNSIGRARR